MCYVLRRPQFIRESRKPSKELPFYAHVGITFGTLVLVTLVALFLSNIGIAMSFAGTTIVPILCYIFPTIALWKLHRLQPEQISTKLLIIVSSSGLIVSFIAVLGFIEQIMIILQLT